MPEPRHVEFQFNIPEATALASYMGAQSDMRQVKIFCDVLIERYAGDHLKKSEFDIVGFSTPIDFDEWDAFTAAACIRYARCFKTGVRIALDPLDVASAKPDYVELHEFVIALRDKHIAHSVNAFEDNVVMVTIRDDFQSALQVDTVSARHTRRSGLAMRDPARLKDLSQWWYDHLEVLIRAERTRLLEIARRTPIADLRAAGEVPPEPLLRSVTRRRSRA